MALQIFCALGGTGLVAWIAKWFWNLGKRVEKAEREVRVLNGAIESFLQVIQQNGKLSKSEAQVLAKSIKFHAEAEGNPITAAEAQRLNQFIQWAREGRQFAPEQAREFHELSEKYRNDPKVLKKTPADELGALLVLAGIIFTLYALSSGGKNSK